METSPPPNKHPTAFHHWLLAVLGTALFALSAMVQLNDPDPLAWFAIYSIAALLTLVSPLRRRPLQVASAVLAVTAALWMGWLLVSGLPDWDQNFLSMDPAMKTPGVELWRETLGLLLIVLCHGGIAMGARTS